MKNVLYVIFLVAAGCGSDTEKGASPWGLDEDHPPSTTDDPVETPPVTEDPVETPTDGPPSCGEATVHVLSSGQPPDAGRAPLVVGDRVFVSAFVEGGNPDIMEWDEGNGLQRLAGTPEDDRIVGVSPDWLWSTDGQALHRLSLSTGAFEPAVDGVQMPSSFDFGGYAQPRQNAAADRFAWRADNALHLFDGSELRSFDVSGARYVWVTEDTFAWSSWNGSESQLVVENDDGRGIRFSDEEFTYASPVVAEGWAYYLRDGQVERAAYLGAAIDDVITGKTCGPLHTDGTTLVVACDPEARDSYPAWGDYIELYASELWQIDAASGEAELLHTTSGSQTWIYAPLVNNDWIAWVEYAPLTNSQMNPLGTIKVLPRGGDEPFDVARMGQGCPYCGAYWPAPHLMLGDDTLGFNYAVSDDGDPTNGFPDRGAAGVARLRPCD